MSQHKRLTIALTLCMLFAATSIGGYIDKSTFDLTNPAVFLLTASGVLLLVVVAALDLGFSTNKRHTAMGLVGAILASNAVYFGFNALMHFGIGIIQGALTAALIGVAVRLVFEK